jgi:hypothetical protein
MYRNILCCLLVSAASLFAANAPLDFNRDIRPILSDKCYHCHGPDAIAKHIPLRLDSEAAAKRDLGGHRAIVDGDTAASELVKRITADKARRMPPVYSGYNLTPAEIDTLKNWIAQGAKWEKHWSLVPPRRPEVPHVAHASWVRNPIDAFIAQRLEKEELAPSPEASRETLIRRVSFDLTGLPPTPAEIDAFLKDKSPNAYEKVVDRLLASPRYGERMAARWLDAARYADSNGYQYDGERHMWRWRDWVIDAFNRNEPYDRFTVEQLAGDLLPHPTRDQIIATGFNRNHRANTEDGIIPEEYAVEYVVDRVETTSAVFMGMTLGCARCHNHKYDPFTQKEFYQVFAYFNQVPESGRAMKYGNSPPMIAAPTADELTKEKQMTDRIGSVERALAGREQKLSAERKTWEREIASAKPVYWAPSTGLEPLETTCVGEVPQATGRTGPAWVFDGKSYLDAGKNTGKIDIQDRFTVSAWVYSDGVPDGSVISRMQDNPKGKGYGVHLDHGKVHVNITGVWVSDAIRVETKEALTPAAWHHIAVTYSGSRMAEGIKVFIDGKEAPVDVQMDTLYRPFGNAGRPYSETLRIGAGWGPERRFHGRIQDARFYDRVLDHNEIEALASAESVNEIAAKPAAQRTALEQLQIREYYLEHAAPEDLRAADLQIHQLQQEKERYMRSYPTVMVMEDSPTPKDTFLLIRGAYDKHGEKVQPGLPAVLPPMPPGLPNNRLGFAKWLVSPENPLLARVTVNRFWQMYFGTGIVKTVEDFGVQGEWPSHPALLDWLATEFMRTGWDVKALQKMIVTSATYRQRSEETPEIAQRDPENRLLSHGPRFRLSPEMVRDAALFESGLLVEKLGGPSVKPYQPAGLWKEMSMQDMDYDQSHGPDLYRRSLYTFWKRTIAPPMMVNFDAANRETCVVRETRTNTPLQALDLMNDVTFVEASRVLGERMLREGGSDDAARLKYGFRLVTGRYPRDTEEQVLLSSLRFHRDYFGGDENRLHKYLSEGEHAPDPKLNPRDVAAYGAVGSLIMNLDEAITKE